MRVDVHDVWFKGLDLFRFEHRVFVIPVEFRLIEDRPESFIQKQQLKQIHHFIRRASAQHGDSDGRLVPGRQFPAELPALLQ